jgi:tRNA-dihydrouridine synthase
VAEGLRVPVLGSGDCVEPEQIVEHLRTSAVRGVLVGRGVLRNPWILAQAHDLAEGRPARVVSMADRGQFLLDYIDLLLRERVDEAEGFRHSAVHPAAADRPARGRERWVINKLRALGSWYTKGLENGSHLRTAINACDSLPALRGIIGEFFFGGVDRAAERVLCETT